MRNTFLGLIGLSVLIASSGVSAQSGPSGVPGPSGMFGAPELPDITRARVRFGRLLLNPTIGLTNFGVDTNVFNEPDQLAPKRDFTATVTPQTDLWLRLGRSWLTGNLREDLVWYQTHASERSANSRFRGGWILPLNRVLLGAGAEYLHTRERPGFEVDARSQRTEIAYGGGAEIRARPKIFVGLRGERRTIDFDSVATFAGVNLREALNRTVTSQAASLRHQVTTMTSVTLHVVRTQDRFEFSPSRDSDSTRVLAGVKLDSRTFIRGTAAFGFRDFQPRSSNLPAYKGMTAAADVSYVARVRTRIAMQALRDVDYSFDINQPYYVISGVSGSLEHQIFDRLDVIGRIGVMQLDYRGRTGAAVQAPNRIDDIRTSGGGIGYRLGNDLRIRFNVDRQHRSSRVSNHEYHGLTFGTSVTYVQ